jgi:hypothetical protein
MQKKKCGQVGKFSTYISTNKNKISHLRRQLISYK